MVKKNNQVNCIIDTMQLTNNINNFKDINIITLNKFPYIIFLKDNITITGAYRTYKLNLNNKYTYKSINSLGKHKQELKDTMNKIGIIDKENLKMDRVDIAIDSNINFSDNFKFLLFLFELITFNNKKSDKWYTTNIKTNKKNSIKMSDRIFEVVIYNKSEESNNKHNFNTRIEFRFKKIASMEFEKHIDNLIFRLKDIEKNIELLEEEIINRLINFWNEEKEELQNFSEFIRRYNNYFYTINILKEVYRKSGLTGNYRSWLKRFKENNNHIIFFSKTNIVNYKKIMIKSIKKYKKN